ERRIGPLLKSLAAQQYSGRWEVVFIDDHSSDNGPVLVKRAIEAGLPGKLITLDVEGGKKAALAKGAKIASGTWLATIDADVQIGPLWMSQWVASCIEHQWDMLILPVMCTDRTEWVAQFQTLEFLGLQFATMGAAGMQLPVMCNGANLVVRASHYQNVVKDIRQDLASGDDMFLLTASIRSGANVGCLRSRQVVAIVEPEATWRAMIHQRLRWASKTGSYPVGHILMVAALVWLANVAAAFAWIAFLSGMGPQWLVVVLLKTFSDLPGMVLAARWFGQQRAMRWWLPMAVLYPLYAAIVPLLAVWTKQRWKQRPLKNFSPTIAA
ncbi:MAG: glycosyltransferase, partial [Flavobacteriales bacterium]|nr:glycosyltransferase [Flavobacteriales bacterium]